MSEANDIVIPQEKMGEFLFMDFDQEQQQFGASTKISQELLQRRGQKANKYKQIMDFKVRALDFIAIYVKEMKKKENSQVQMQSFDLIKGLLKTLQVAHQDKHTILFDRIKTILSTMAKSQSSNKQASKDKQDVNMEEGKSVEDEENGGSKESKILLTEMMGLLLRPCKDEKLLKTYVDCFIVLTKHLYESSLDDQDGPLFKFLVFTFKELLKKLLQSRNSKSAALNAQLFKQVFEACPTLGWQLVKPLLKCFLAKSQSEDEESKKEEDQDEGSRSNHQRLQAMEIFGFLIKASQNNDDAKSVMVEHMELTSKVICRVIVTADTWQNKKVKKTGQCVQLFSKMAKTVINEPGASKQVSEQGAKIIKAIEEQCEQDKTMANLKSKVNEIKHIISKA